MPRTPIVVLSMLLAGALAGCTTLAAPGEAQPARVTATPAARQLPPGAFYTAPEGPGPHAAIVVLGGSEGGDWYARSMAPVLAKAGYAVVGLPYYSPQWFDRPRQFPELPAAFAALPVDTVHAVRGWLCDRPDIACDRVGVLGVSKGAELALLAASLEPGFAATAAIVPSDVVWEGWGPGTTVGEASSFSWRGRPLPFVPYDNITAEFAKFATGGRPDLRGAHERGRHAHPDRAAAARIRVEAIATPVFVAGGDADETWNSGGMAQAIAERRAAAGLDTQALIYAKAGHNLSGDGTAAKGLSEADQTAQQAIRPAMMAFFARTLGPGAR